MGRFISSDPAKAGDNWYAYCSNNPLAKSDPTGLAPPKEPSLWDRLLHWLRSYNGPRHSILDPSCGDGCNAPKIPRPDTPKSKWKNPEIGNIVGWGAGEKGAIDRAANITKADVDLIKQSGIPKELIQQWKDFYRDIIPWLKQQPRVGDVDTPDARVRLLKKVLQMWDN